MLNPRLASRYAKSLLDLAIERKSIEETLKDIKLVHATVQANPELALVLKSPIIKGDKKEAIVEAIFRNELTPITRGFIRLLISKGRESVLPEMLTAFIHQYKVMNHISQVQLITAAPVSESVKESIRAKVAAALPGQTIDLTTKVEPELIGGYILEMGDKRIDASIKRDLHDIKKQFLENLYVPNIR